MKRMFMVIVSCMLILGMAGIAPAAPPESRIEYTESGSGPYNLTFDVFNDGLPDSIQWFSIYFGQTTDGLNFTNTAEFSNFSPDFNGTAAPAGWFSYSFEQTAIDNPGAFNSDASGAGIALGDNKGGFNVSFDWTGVGSYDGLFYKVGNFDQAGGYNDLDTGYTEKHQGIPGVPEPGTMVLLLAGLSGLGFLRKKMEQA